jgi:hypothetical protein
MPANGPHRNWSTNQDRPTCSRPIFLSDELCRILVGYMVWNDVKKYLPIELKHRPKVISSWPLSFWVARLVNSADRHRVQVVAMRRSGHHAIVNWLISAFEGSAVQWSPQRQTVEVAPSGYTAFINDLNNSRSYFGHYEVARRFAAVRAASRVISNLEDVALADLPQHLFAQRNPDVQIYVRRPVLDLVASRIKAQQAWGAGSERTVPVDRWLMDTLLSNERQLHGWLVIDYDRWLTNADDHRHQVLQQLGLSFDHMPSVSPFGQGSSFTGVDRVPSPEELMARHRQIDWPAEILAMLREPQYRSLLRPEDEEFLNGLQQA